MKSIILLSSGTLLAQVINFVTVPFMTRFFSADDIGVFTYITTITYLFTPIICLRYENAIVLEDEEYSVYALIKLCFIVSFILTVIISSGYYCYFMLLEKNNVGNYICVIAFLLLVSGVTNILNSYNTREEEYVILTKVPVYRAIANMLTILFFGFVHMSLCGLLISHSFSQVTGLWQQGKKLIKNRRDVVNIQYIAMLNVLKKYKSLPLFSVPAIFFNNLSYLSINFLIAELYGMEQLAYYAISQRILGVPLSIITYNVGNVFFEKASKELNESGTYSLTYTKTLCLLCVLCIPIIGSVYFFAPWFCEIYLGNEWYIAGVYVRIMCVMFAFKFIFSPLSAGILVVKKNKLEMVCQMCFFMIVTVAYLISMQISVLPIENFLLIISIGFALVYLIFGIVVYKLSTIRCKDI